MLHADTGIKESVSRAKLWINDTWLCSTCCRSSLKYPNIGWSELDGEILCLPCFLQEHEITDYTGLWRIDESRFISSTPPVVEDVVKSKDFWYYWVWTLAPNHTIEEVRANIERFVNRDLGIYYCDISLEHGDESGREHYNMRIRSSRCIKGQRVKPYEKAGKINRQTIRKHTEDNWDNVGNYVTKENPVEVLIS